MDLGSVASDLANQFGLGDNSNSNSDNSIDAIAHQLAIDHDLKSPVATKRLYVSPIAPPISGLSQEESDARNREIAKIPAYKGGPQGGGILDTASDIAKSAYNKGYEDLNNAATTAREGLTQTFSGLPVSGLSNIGKAGLIAAGIAPDVVGNVAANVTGNEDLGNKVALLPIGGSIGVGRARDLMQLPRNKALGTLINTITEEGRNPQALVDTIKAMRSDPRVGPIDTSPAAQSMAQKLFVTEGDAAKNHLYNTSKERVGNLPADVTNAYNAVGGVPVDVVKKVAGLAQAAKDVGEQQIQGALSKAKPVNIQNTLDAIDATLKPGVWAKIDAESSLPLSNVKKELTQVRAYLGNKVEQRTDAQDLHKFQSGLRRTAEGLMSSADGAQRQLGYQLSKVRNSLVSDIDASAPGYKDALGKFRDQKQIAEAFNHAHNDVFSKSTAMENAPEVMQQWFNGLSDQEKEAAREGARLAVRSRMGVADNASLAGTNFAKSEYNQEKLKVLFGEEETNKLLQSLQNTRAIKNTDQKIIEGSQTAMRLANDSRVALPVRKEEGSNLGYAPAAIASILAPGTGLATVLATGKTIAKGAGGVRHFIATQMKKEENAHLAKLMLPKPGSEERAQLIRDLENAIPAPKQSLITRAMQRFPIRP